MKQKHNHPIINRYTLGILALLFIAGAVAVAINLQRTFADTSQSPGSSSKLPQKTPGEPQFSFNFSAAPDWRQGPTDKISMAAFYESYGCFISVVHRDDTVNVRAELKKYRNALTKTGNASTPLGTIDMTLQTSTGKKQYKLHQFRASGSDIKGGQELGYLQLSKGYVEIEGYCDTAEHLPATIPALKAIKFDASK